MTGWLQRGLTPAARAKEQELLNETMAVLHAKNLCDTGSVLFCVCSAPGMCTWSSALNIQEGLGRNLAAQHWEEQGGVCVPLMQLGQVPRNAFLDSLLKKGAF